MTFQPVSRRVFIRRAGAGIGMLNAGALLAACGSSGSGGGASSSSQAPASAQGTGLNVSPGSDIPTVKVNFGVAPFADGAIYVIAMKEGWFGDVGIDFEPKPAGLQTTADNAIAKLLSGDADVDVVFGPGMIQNEAKAPQIKLFAMANSFTGTQILVSPSRAKQSVAQLMASGTPFQTAVKQAFAPMKRQAIGLSNTGQRRTFIQNYFQLAGLTFGDVKPISTSDAQILQLARGGHITYASPEGAAQQVALLGDGWKVLASIQDLIKGLPPGDPRAISAIGHECLAASDSYIAKNRETCLRLTSVMFRTIDAIKTDPMKAASDEAPYLTSVTGVNTPAKQLASIQKELFDFRTFEQQTLYWDNLSGPFSYKTIYTAQIAAAKKDGIIPKNSPVTAQDIIVGGSIYQQLVQLKAAYDKLKPKASNLNGAKATLAAKAAKQYQNWNYLDAYRMLNAAVGKA
jgi:ABC-type nitrate/sulfonate/bicarbonate transport system substrate-binding protein